MGSRAVPQVDMLQVANSARVTRMNILKFLPQIGLTCVNYREIGEMDYLYLDCQSYRDYYCDPLKKLHPPKAFCQYRGACGKKTDHDLEQILKPVHWVTERQPVVFPIDYGHRMNLDGNIPINAHFHHKSSTVYKR